MSSVVLGFNIVPASTGDLALAQLFPLKMPGVLSMFWNSAGRKASPQGHPSLLISWVTAAAGIVSISRTRSCFGEAP